MKLFLILSFGLHLISVANAEIYKCESSNGKVIYQQKVCANLNHQKIFTVNKLAPEKVFLAQEKLKMELQQHAEQKAIKLEQETKEREIMAIEAQAQSNKELLNATKANANAIDQNTQAIKSNNRQSYPYYYYPQTYQSRPKKIRAGTGIPKPKTKHKKHKKQSHLSLSIK